jgi:hypothetical protein
MSALREEIYVNCPVSLARRHLSAFFSEHTRLALRVPLGIPGLKTGLLMRRDVSATIKQVQAVSDAFEDFSVNWEAIGGGPFPRFAGKIEVQGDEDYDSFRLVLQGTYDPPLGVAGEAFDALVGRWIAIATARDLLERVREAVEASYRALEDEKVAHRVGPT